MPSVERRHNRQGTSKPPSDSMRPSHLWLQRMEGLEGRTRQAESQAAAERQQREACEAEAEGLRQQLRALQQQLSDMQPAVPSGSMVSKRLTACC